VRSVSATEAGEAAIEVDAGAGLLEPVAIVRDARVRSAGATVGCGTIGCGTVGCGTVGRTSVGAEVAVRVGATVRGVDVGADFGADAGVETGVDAFSACGGATVGFGATRGAVAAGGGGALRCARSAGSA
jgi:hypothetical protein